MKGKEYYYEHRWTGRELPNGHLESFECVRDYCNRVTKYTTEDFKNNPNYFQTSYNGNFARIINMKIIKGAIFRPSPWPKEYYKDQVLYLYNDKEKYEKDLALEPNKRYSYFSLVCDNDVFDFIEEFRKVNPELADEIGLIVELTKDERM